MESTTILYACLAFDNSARKSEKMAGLEGRRWQWLYGLLGSIAIGAGFTALLHGQFDVLLRACLGLIPTAAIIPIGDQMYKRRKEAKRDEAAIVRLDICRQRSATGELGTPGGTGIQTWVIPEGLLLSSGTLVPPRLLRNLETFHVPERNERGVRFELLNDFRSAGAAWGAAFALSMLATFGIEWAAALWGVRTYGIRDDAVAGLALAVLATAMLAAMAPVIYETALRPKIGTATFDARAVSEEELAGVVEAFGGGHQQRGRTRSR